MDQIKNIVIEEYWLKKLSGDLTAISLPWLQDVKKEITVKPQSNYQLNIPLELMVKLKKITKNSDIGFFILFLNVLNICLHKYTIREDLIVGALPPKMDGKDLNMLFCRTQITPYLTVKESINLTKKEVLDAVKYSEFSLVNILAELQIKNQLLDIFKIALVYETPQKEDPFIDRFDLVFVLAKSNTQMILTVKYDQSPNSKEMVERFSRNLIYLLERIIDAPEQKIGILEAVNEEEKRQLLYEFNNTAAEYPRDKTIHGIFTEQVKRTPDRIAIIGSTISYVETLRATSLHITYLQLNEQSNGLAYVLQTKGVQPDTIAGIMVERSYEMIVGILGILKSGGAYLPIAPEYPQERIEYMLKDSGANLLITANNIEGEKVRRYEGEQIHIEHILHHPEHLSLHHTSLITHHSNYLAYIIYTSGTTGKPKGVMIEHYNVVRLLFNNRFQFDFNDRDVWSLFHSYSFDFSVWEIYGALLYGGQLIIISRENTINPPQFLKTIKKFQVTILNQTPSAFYNLINEELSKENKDLKLRYVIFGGDALRPSKLKEWHERYPLTRLVNMFGITETTVHVTYKEIKEEEIRAENSNIGGPIPTLTVYIMNQFQRLMPLGAVGELCVGGAGVARGYLNRPELTAEKFVENPYKPGELFYKSGDLARIIRNGDMEYLGRKDHQVKIRGYRIELEEIEKQLLKHPSIGDCIVIDRLDTSGNKILCAYYICKTAGHDINEEELKVYLSKEQPEYMIPAHFISIEKIPLTTNGKPDRKALPEPGLHINDGREYIPPENTTQAKLVEIWSQVLGVEKKLIGITANFFQLGGHSLNAAIVISKIHKDLNVKIPLAEIFKGPTIQELSQKIKTLKTEIYADIEPVEKKEYYRLSSAQKRLYFLQQKDSDSIGYNILTSVVLEGSIDIPLLEDTFRKLIKRHESLRTSFDVVNDEIVQRISENVEFKIEYYDNENISVHDNFVRAFDLSKAPLMRIGLFRLEAQAHLLLTDLHHIISDGVSHAILKEDFEILYNGDSLPALQLHYKDYSEWQNDEKQKQIVSKQKTFWLNNLSGNISILQLPIDYPRPIIQNFEGDSITFKLGNVEVERLNKLCKDHEVTLYMVLLAIFNILMAKLSNHDEILLGTPVAGRRHVDLERIIGMFVNTLALKNYPNAEKTFTDFLKEVKENTIQAFENQDFQFEELVELLAVKRDNSRNPIFDVAFVLQNINTQMKGTPGKVISNISMRMQPHLHTKSIAKFDLTLTALEITGGINFSLTYCIRLFKKETIQRMIDYFQKIIQDVLKTPNILLAKIEILSEKEKKRLLYDFNDTAAKYPREKTIHQLFEEQVERTPDHIAVVEETPNGSLGTYNYLSYRELNKWADNVAQSLIENGVKPDTIVGIMIDRIPGMIAGIFGILKSKGVYLPIDPDYPQERIDFILKDSAAKIIVVGNRQVYSQKSNLQVSILNCELMRTPRMPFYHSSFISNSSHLVYIIYTSGTTGKPKGVLIEGKNVVRLMFNDRFQFNFSDRDVWSFFHSYNFDFSVWEMYGALLYGGKLLIIPKITTRDTAKFLKFLKKNQVTILNQTPSAFCNLSALELNSPGKELNIKYIIFGGEALVPSHLKEWKSKYPKTKLINMYGITETTVHVTFKEIDESDIELDISNIGKPIPTLNTYIMDTNLNLQPVGVAGELVIGGEGVGRGYLNRPELSKEKFLENPYKHGERLYKSGDLVKLLSMNDLQYIGRIDQQVKIRGFRIELGEIESHLMKHPSVKDTVVLSKEDKNGDKFLYAYVILVNNTFNREELISTGLHNYLSSILPDYMVPTYFIPIEKIPLTINGKVDKKSLPELEIDEKETNRLPGNKIEEKLLELWAEVLGIEQETISINSNFFELGGHSLKATILISKIHKSLNTKIALAEVFKNPTVRELAQIIMECPVKKFSYIEAVEKKEYYDLSSAQKRLYVLHQMEPNSIVYNMPELIALKEEPDKDVLERAFIKIIERHECLRTSFHEIREKIVQRCFNIADVVFKIDYSGTWINDINRFIRTFDLSKPPLLRVGLLKNEEEKYFLLLDLHHIICDGISHEILVKDFMTFYAGGTLPPLRIQYKDFSEWQNGEKEKANINQQELYWLKEFEGNIPLLDLPIDSTRPIVQSFEGDAFSFKIAANDTSTLKKMAIANGVTLYILLLGAFNVLLSKLSRQEDIIIGTPISGRRHADLENIIGMFVNTLAIRNYPVSDKNFMKFLSEVKNKVLKASENQDYQFEYLVKKIVTNRDTGRNPIFDVFFVKNEQNVLSKELTQNVLPKKALTFKLKNRTAKFDITLHVAENNEILRCQFAYCSKLFKKETIERFAAYFKNILSLIVNAPDISLSNIEIITEIEKHQLLYYFNNTDVEFPCYQTIQQLFEENVEKVSDRVAIISMGYEHITYRELNEKTNRLACILLNRGAEPDTIISIIMKRSIKMIIGILGILKAGGAYMPIEPGYPRERIDYMLKDSGVKLLLTESEIGNHKDVTVPLDQNKYQHFGEASVLNFNNLNLNSSKQPSPLGSSNSWVFPAGINPSNIAYVIYTSGSTGRPKGVLVRHEGVTNAIYWRKNEYCLGTNDNVLQLFSYAFDGFVTSFFTPIISGSRVVLQDDEKSKDIFSIKETILSMQITHFICVPSLYRSLLELCSTGELSNLRTITLAGDAVIPALLEKSRQLHPKLKVMIEYGATENTIVASIHKNALPDKGITIGKPIANTKIYILDRAGYLVPIGVSGEIYIAGIGVARGYLNQPELTATKFKKNVIRHSSLAICSINNLTNEQCPMNNSNSKKFSHEYLYHTGDLGRWLPDGNIEFKGRIDLQVKVRGFRIELTEIENELLKHTAVKDAVVSLKETISGEKYLCAYIVLDKSVGDGKSANIFNIEELKEYLAQRLPAYMLPSFIMPLEKIHLNANGKIDRNVLPIPDRSDAPSGKSQETPRDMIDRKLVKIWANVLNMDEKNIGIDDNFFHLGGHSLNATILVSKIHKEFNVKLSLVEIFKKNTISKLSETIKNQGKNKYASLMPVEKMEYYPLTPGQKRYYVIHLMNKHSTGFNIYRVIEIKGILHREKIENIFQELVHRHESLRTSFMLLNHEPVQRIHDHLQLNIEYYDISMEKSTISRQQLHSELMNGFIRPFDLSKAPLMRIRLIKKEEYLHALMVELHHIVADGMSHEILVKEFAALYDEEKLSPLKLQYKDFALWQSNEKKKETINQQKKYWLKQFEGTIPELKLPYDFAPQSGTSYEGQSIHFNISVEDTAILKQMVLQELTTLYMLLLAVLNILMAKLCGEEDIIIGTLHDGRRHPDVQPLIGMFVNTIVLRNRPEGNKTFREFLGELTMNTFEALDNQDYPFEDILEELGINKERKSNAFIKVFFGSHDVQVSGTSSKQISAIKPSKFESRKKVITMPFDLGLGFTLSEKIYMHLDYSNDLFKQSTINKIKDYYLDILKQVMKNEQILIKDIQIQHNLIKLLSPVLSNEENDFVFK